MNTENKLWYSISIGQGLGKLTSKVELPSNDKPIALVGLDEMHSYVGSKKTTVGYGLLLVDLQNGSSHLCVEEWGQKQV